MHGEDLKGKKYNRLLVLRDSGERAGSGAKLWLCLCDCGETRKVRGCALKENKTVSCGCYNKETNFFTSEKLKGNKNSQIHGQYKSPTWESWHSMLQRCTNPNNPNYSYYGERGITICDRWLEFKNFLEDMGNRLDGMTLDRIDNNKNYEPGNCKWSTATEQARNRRNNKLDEDTVSEIRHLIKSNKYLQKDIAAMFNVCPSMITQIKQKRTWI